MDRSVKRLIGALVASFTLLSISCSQGARRSGIPPAAQAALDAATQDIDAGRYDQLYDDAADEWRKDSTLDDSRATLQRAREKLGRAQGRNLITAREEQTGTAPVAGHSLVAIYQTSFERGEAMETFTLIERGGRWYLAKYFVSSTALQ